MPLRKIGLNQVKGDPGSFEIDFGTSGNPIDEIFVQSIITPDINLNNKDLQSTLDSLDDRLSGQTTTETSLNTRISNVEDQIYDDESIVSVVTSIDNRVTNEVSILNETTTLHDTEINTLNSHVVNFSINDDQLSNDISVVESTTLSLGTRIDNEIQSVNSSTNSVVTLLNDEISTTNETITNTTNSFNLEVGRLNGVDSSLETRISQEESATLIIGNSLTTRLISVENADISIVNSLTNKMSIDIDAAINGLINGAPNTLDTLNEIASAITGNDSDITTILTTQTSLNNRITSEVGSVDIRVNSVSTEISTEKSILDQEISSVNSSIRTDVSGLETRLDSDIVSGITSIETVIGNLTQNTNNDLSTTNSTIVTNQSTLILSVNSLNTRVTTTESDITINTSNITSLQTRLIDNENNDNSTTTSINESLLVLNQNQTSITQSIDESVSIQLSNITSINNSIIVEEENRDQTTISTINSVNSQLGAHITENVSSFTSLEGRLTELEDVDSVLSTNISNTSQELLSVQNTSISSDQSIVNYINTKVDQEVTSGASVNFDILNVSKIIIDNHVEIDTDTVTSAMTINKDVEINGELRAVSKSFLIDHPTKKGLKLQYGNLEGPEHGVYLRGKVNPDGVITLPEYWSKLVDMGTMTVQITPIGIPDIYYVQQISDNFVTIMSKDGEMNAYYFIQAERKDIDKLNIEI